MEKDRGTNFVLVAVRENQPLRLRTAPLIFAATVLTHLLGGSSGREGAILQIGGSLSSKIGRWMHLDDKDSRIITMCGMSAAFSALFGTPLTAAMFAMEVTSVGVLYYAAIVPCVLSAIIGLWVAQLCGVPPTAFSLQGVPNLTPVTLLQCIGMGVLFALLSILFCRMMHAAPRLYDKYLPNPVARAAAGGALVIALTFLVWLWNPGTYDYNGAGTAVIHAAIGGEARPEAFLLKMLFTTITLGAGFKGGEIVPVFFTGATFGCTAAPLLGLHRLIRRQRQMCIRDSPTCSPAITASTASRRSSTASSGRSTSTRRPMTMSRGQERQPFADRRPNSIPSARA